MAKRAAARRGQSVCPSRPGTRAGRRASAAARGALLAAQDRVRGARGRAAPNSAVVIRRTRWRGRPPRRSPRRSRPTCSRGRRDVVDAVRKLDTSRRLGEVADVRRPASLVVDDRHLVALRAEPKHRAQEVVARRAEEPRRAHDHALSPAAASPCSFVRPYAPSGDGGSDSTYGVALRPVEDVVGRQVTSGTPSAAACCVAADIDRRRALGIVLRAVDVRPCRSVQDERRVEPLGRRVGNIPLRPRQRAARPGTPRRARARADRPRL